MTFVYPAWPWPEYTSDDVPPFQLARIDEYWTREGRKRYGWVAPNIEPVLNLLGPHQQLIAASVATSSVLPPFYEWARMQTVDTADAWYQLLDRYKVLIQTAINKGREAGRELLASFSELFVADPSEDPNLGPAIQNSAYYAGDAMGWYLMIFSEVEEDHRPDIPVVTRVENTIDASLYSYVVNVTRSNLSGGKALYSKTFRLKQIKLANAWLYGWWQAVMNVLAWQAAGVSEFLF